MADFRLPGPLCRILGALDIDVGTMCRAASPPPGPVVTSTPSQPVATVPLTQARLGDLETDVERMNELMAHLDEREGLYPYFYCDHNGLVTIGIGHLVDQRGASDASGQAIARRLAVGGEVVFRHRDTDRLATADEVVEDWQRIKDRGRTHPGGARSFERTARLHITEEAARQLSQSKVRGNIARIYDRRPFARRLDTYIIMAFVDVLYNPSGVALFRETAGDNFHRSIPDLWAALNPDAPTYDLDRALELFRDIWINRGVPRYQERHRMRVDWFRRGVEAMQGIAP